MENEEQDRVGGGQAQEHPPTHRRLTFQLERSEPMRSRKGRKGSVRTPQQQARSVDRRNARERKRVCLVNQGFANLRDHVPPRNGTFEGKGPKKLSKVETLRSAIEYIKQLREAIGYADDNMDDDSKSNMDSSFYDDDRSPLFFSTTPSDNSCSISPVPFRDDADDFMDLVDWTVL